MKPNKNQPLKDIVKIISQDRERTNILRSSEQKAIAFLVKKVPSWISSDMLTAIGFSGNVLVFVSFILGAVLNPIYLLVGLAGFAISWFGDSLDGRIAYYRNKPRKWYGFSLDLTTDWIGVVLIGWGYVIYARNEWEILGFGFVVLYGWEILTTLLRYKVTNKYSIDSGLLGPTEVRVVLSFILILEVLVRDSILISGLVACIILLISNIVDTTKLLKLADGVDREENAKKQQNSEQQNSEA